VRCPLLTQIGQGSENVKFNDNLAAIETLKKIEYEERRATPEEQRMLARYVDWGATLIPSAHQTSTSSSRGSNEVRPF
jgi:hypothetical protein